MDIGELIGKKKNSNNILMNTIYHKLSYTEDAISLVFKNQDTLEKDIVLIENPKIEAYVAKEGVNIERNQIDIPIDKVKKVDMSYRNIEKDIAELTGNKAKFYDMCKKRMNTKAFHGDKNVFHTDVDIEDFYKYKCKTYLGVKDVFKLSKGYLDIEVDYRDEYFDVKIPEGDAPINAVTIVDGNRRVSYTLLLRNSKNPLIAEFEKDIPRFISEVLPKEFEKKYGKYEYKIAMFDENDELGLIKAIFHLINGFKPDFVMIWNMAFDIQYILHRIKQLGGDPAEIICDERFKYKECYYHYDTFNSAEIPKRTDYFKCSATTTYIDQMVNFASIRKAKCFESYSLDFIGEEICNIHKLPYDGLLCDLPYEDYIRFVLYNINDVLMQQSIEDKLLDIETLYELAYTTNTRFSKANKESILLANMSFEEFKHDQSLIVGNNINALRGSDGKKVGFPGAIVGNPLLNKPNGIRILGHRSSSVFEDIMDYDYASLYPFIIVTGNIYPTTQIGRIMFSDENISDRESAGIDEPEKYIRSGKFIDDLELKEPVLFGYRWFNLPSADDMIKDFAEQYEQDTKIKLKLKTNSERKKKVKMRFKKIEE